MSAFKNKSTLEFNNEDQDLSGSDDGDLDVLSEREEQDGPAGKALSFNHTDSFGMSKDVIVQNVEIPVYYAHMSMSVFSRNKPDITLYRESKDGAIVAASFLGRRKFILGIGSDETSMIWTELKRGGHFMTKHYSFDWKGENYTLQRATSNDTGVTGFAKLMLTHFKVLQADSGDVLALYVSNKFGKRKGMMKMKPGLPEELEILCILGVASWREMIRREQAQGGGGGG